MGMYSQFKGPLTKPSGKTKTAEQAMVSRKPRTIKASGRYEELKAIIQTYFENRVKAAAALKEIHSQKLYKKEYDTFEEFCHHECGMSRAQAYRQLELPAISQSLEMSQIETRISNEYQARALAAVPDEKRVNVLKQAAKSGSVTAKSINAAAHKVIDIEAAPERARTKHCPTCTCD